MKKKLLLFYMLSTVCFTPLISSDSEDDVVEVSSSGSATLVLSKAEEFEVTLRSVQSKIDELSTSLRGSFDSDVPRVVLIGDTGVGKSTVLDLLLGRKVVSAVDEYYEPVLTTLADSEVDTSVHTGRKIKAIQTDTGVIFTNESTEEPAIVTADGCKYFDMPGFRDRKGIETELLNTYFYRRVFDSPSDTKVLYVINYNILTAPFGRGKDFLEQLKSLSNLFTGEEWYKDGSVHFVINRVPRTLPVSGIIAKMNKLANDPEFAEELKPSQQLLLKMLSADCPLFSVLNEGETTIDLDNTVQRMTPSKFTLNEMKLSTSTDKKIQGAVTVQLQKANEAYIASIPKIDDRLSLEERLDSFKRTRVDYVRNYLSSRCLGMFQTLCNTHFESCLDSFMLSLKPTQEQLHVFAKSVLRDGVEDYMQTGIDGMLLFYKQRISRCKTVEEIDRCKMDFFDSQETFRRIVFGEQYEMSEELTSNEYIVEISKFFKYAYSVERDFREFLNSYKEIFTTRFSGNRDQESMFESFVKFASMHGRVLDIINSFYFRDFQDQVNFDAVDIAHLGDEWMETIFKGDDRKADRECFVEARSCYRELEHDIIDLEDRQTAIEEKYRIKPVTFKWLIRMPFQAIKSVFTTGADFARRITDTLANAGEMIVPKSVRLGREARAGNVDSQYELGLMHYSGTGLLNPLDTEAISLFTLASNSGHVKSKYYLAIMHIEGFGTEIDYAKAHDLFKEASDANHIESTYELSLMYLNGTGVHINYEKALNLLILGSDAGHIKSQYLLAEMFYEGFGTERDLVEAFELYKSSSDNGHIGATIRMGKMLERGMGCDVNKTLALQCYNSVKDISNNARGEYIRLFQVMHGYYPRSY